MRANILILTKNLRTDSGIGRYSREMVRGLIAEGYTVTVLTEEGDPIVHELGAYRHYAKLRPATSALRMLVNAFIARRHARGHQSVHAFEGWPYVLCGYAATAATARRLYMTAHGTYAVAPLASRAKGFLLRVAYRHTQTIFCVSRYTEQQLRAQVSDLRTSVIHSGVTPLSPVSPEERERFSRQYELGDKGPIFLTVGEIKERKGQLDTLKGLALLKEAYPHFLYVLVGSGAQKQYIAELRAYAKEEGLEQNLLLVTDSEDDEIPAFFYEACDMVLLTSNSDHGHFEGFGLVLLEAAHFGKPAIGSRDCGIEDAIVDGKTGFLVPQKDPAAIADRARRILETSRVFSQHAREHARAFSWRRTIRNYTAQYDT